MQLKVDCTNPKTELQDKMWVGPLFTFGLQLTHFSSISSLVNLICLSVVVVVQYSLLSKLKVSWLLNYAVKTSRPFSTCYSFEIRHPLVWYVIEMIWCKTRWPNMNNFFWDFDMAYFSVYLFKLLVEVFFSFTFQ